MINNIAYYLVGLNIISSTKLMQLFNSMSSPSFLLVNDTNHSLLQSLLESMNSILEHPYKSKLNKRHLLRECAVGRLVVLVWRADDG